jgi:CxxC-x17-CxxC domain-containing protein
MEFQDRTLQCVDCGSDFVWTAGEQAFYADKHFTNEPKRCKPCKAKRGQRQAQNPGGGHERSETRATCSSCGKETTVPFKPSQGRPVYCRDCFQQRKGHGPQGG